MLGDPRSGSNVWEPPDRQIGKSGEDRGQIVAQRELQPPTAFHDRENRCDLRSRLWAAYVDPVLSTQGHCRPALKTRKTVSLPNLLHSTPGIRSY